MTTGAFSEALSKLIAIQQDAVKWGDGAVLVLAGPGSGKTQVLTCRIARLLDESPKQSFKVLALTFTDKAAREMLTRVQTFVPGQEERTSIGTFHSFCAQILRQHGIHRGLQPDFAIFGQDRDRQLLLEDGLREAAGQGQPVSVSDVRFLPIIDKLKVRLVDPASSAQGLGRHSEAEHIAKVYAIYEAQLRKENALDFNSLIFEAHALFAQYPTIGQLVRRIYHYWLLDEFQDTTDGQYRLIKAMGGDTFKNLFAVADDDQIIYQWNGASFRQIQRFSTDYKAEVIQLTENWRCPPAIVEAANRLVAYNANRTTAKKPLVAGKKHLILPQDQHIRLLHFTDDQQEIAGVAEDIKKRPVGERPKVAVLARTRALIEKICEQLIARTVPAVILRRRDEFLSPNFRWLAAFLKQAIRPLDKRNLPLLIESYNRLASVELPQEQVVARAEASGRSYLEEWLEMAAAGTTAGSNTMLLNTARVVLGDITGFRQLAEQMITDADQQSAQGSATDDLLEDLAAWKEISRDIGRHVGSSCTLDQFLQELELRSKEPTPPKNAVALMTIHAAKGREFDFVYLVGLAEDTLPSFQARQVGDQSAEMEEERRNCFVAITRAKEQLTLSWAGKYRGYAKQPSRFLKEMGFTQ